MDRRAFVVAAVVNLLMASGISAQEPAKHYRLGIISAGNPRSMAFYVAFEARLRELGWIDGKNLTVDFETGASPEQLSAIATRMVQHRVDVIVTVGPESTLKAASDATRTIPIVNVAPTGVSARGDSACESRRRSMDRILRGSNSAARRRSVTATRTARESQTRSSI